MPFKNVFVKGVVGKNVIHENHKFTVSKIFISCPEKNLTFYIHAFNGMPSLDAWVLKEAIHTLGKPFSKLQSSVLYMWQIALSLGSFFPLQIICWQALLRCLASPSIFPLAEDMIKSKSRQVITLYNRQDWHFQNHFHVDGNDIAQTILYSLVQINKQGMEKKGGIQNAQYNGKQVSN